MGKELSKNFRLHLLVPGGDTKAFGRELVGEIYSPSEGVVCLGLTALGMQDKRDCSMEEFSPVDVKSVIDPVVRRFSQIFTSKPNAAEAPTQLPDVVSIKTDFSQEEIKDRMDSFLYEVENTLHHLSGATPFMGEAISHDRANHLIHSAIR